MRKIFYMAVLLILAMVATPIYAQSAQNNPCDHLAELVQSKSYADFKAIADTCTPQQKATVEKIVENLNSNDASKWNSVIRTIGETIATTAKELGVAVNDFLKSPAGIILVLFLFFKFIGGKLLAIPTFFFMAWTWYRIIDRFTKDNVEYEYVPYLWGAFKLKRMVSYRRDSDAGTYFGIAGVIFAILWGILTAVMVN